MCDEIWKVTKIHSWGSTHTHTHETFTEMVQCKRVCGLQTEAHHSTRPDLWRHSASIMWWKEFVDGLIDTREWSYVNIYSAAYVWLLCKLYYGIRKDVESCVWQLKWHLYIFRQNQFIRTKTESIKLKVWKIGKVFCFNSCWYATTALDI